MISLQKIKMLIIKDNFLHAMIITGICMLPWIVKMILIDAQKLRSSWYFPVNIQLIKSVLGNLLIGYEGTPWYGWQYTQWLSLMLLLVFIYLIRSKKFVGYSIPLLNAIIIPLTLVISVSFLKPLFVNRYLIFVTLAQSMLLVLAIGAVSHKSAQKLLFLGTLIFFLSMNWFFPQQLKKADFRSAFREINAQIKEGDYVYAANSLSMLESLYYAKNKSVVYLYNPSRSPFPWYVGDILVSEERMKQSFPPYPNKAFLIQPDATYTVVSEYSQ
jgi:hypothetical protein